MRAEAFKIVILLPIFAIVLLLTVLPVMTVAFSELENTTEDVDENLLPTDDTQTLQAYLDSNYGAITSPTTPYEHVILIVVDGVRPDILVGADTPNIDNLTASGSFTWNAWTVTPSVTIAAIPSIYTGATPGVHGVTDWDGEIYAETIVEVFEEAGLPCAIVGQDPILGGYSATYCTGYYSHPQADEHFMSIAIDLLWENDFYFISVYNPIPDKRGHAYGHDSPEYREAIENADYHIGRLAENLKELGVYENTLIVITTDHGMTGTSHGYGYETDMRIFSVWHGPKVKQGYEMADVIYIPASGTYDETYVAHRIIDIAPTMTELVGVRAPENAEGEVIGQIFEEDLTPHDPIYINGNDNFIENNGVVGGSGTENDPYIIENWVISAENYYGIAIWNTTAYFVIRNCLVENGRAPPGYEGIYLDDVRNGKVESCVSRNNYFGIRLVFSNNNTLTNNSCENNSPCCGIRLEDSNYNTLTNNTCENNGRGIHLWYSDNNTLTNNTCENNKYGIYLRSTSDNNHIYHNNFVNNENQAYDSGSNNWDDGYPSGGNYWSDYAGVDENKGENQNIPGSDGIGDTPYYIPGDNNQDRYPLMNPWPPTWAKTGNLENARHVYSLLSASDGAIYAGTASGDDPWNSVGVVFKTTDGGATWVPTANLGGLGVVGNIEAMIQASGGTIDNNIFIGTAWWGKIFKTANSGDNWTEVVDLPGVVEVDTLIQAANGDLYAGVHYSSGIDEARVYRSTDYGDNWEVVAAPSIDGELSGCNLVECLVQASTGYFYCGTKPGHIWRSENGDNWQKVGDKDNDFGESYKIYSLLETSDGYIYAASRNPGNIYRSTDNGDTWTEVANGATELGGATRTDALCQTGDGTIYVGTDVGKIYHSTDGDNWVLGAILPASRVNAIIEANFGCLYAGTSYNGDVFTPKISAGRADFELENLYKVSIEKDLWLYLGSKLVVKFYKYDNTPQDNSAIDNWVALPHQVKDNENVPHPRGSEGFPWGTVQVVRLVLTTDNTADEILPIIATFTVCQSDLRDRLTEIIVAWGGHPELHDAFRAEITDIILQWGSAPP